MSVFVLVRDRGIAGTLKKSFDSFLFFCFFPHRFHSNILKNGFIEFFYALDLLG